MDENNQASFASVYTIGETEAGAECGLMLEQALLCVVANGLPLLQAEAALTY